MEDDKKVTHLENIDQAKAFNQFLAKEISRHLQDIWQAWHDIERVCRKWRIEKPDLPDSDEWIET